MKLKQNQIEIIRIGMCFLTGWAIPAKLIQQYSLWQIILIAVALGILMSLLVDWVFRNNNER